MSWLGDRRARRAFMREIRITALEKSVGVELTHPELDLPTIQVVRNPNGISFMPWVALGFPGDLYGTFESGYNVNTYADTRADCVRAARERLYQIALAKREQPTKVTLT